MKKVRPFFVVLCVLALVSFALGCDGGNTPGGCNGGSSSSSSSSGGAAPVLNASHKGWKKPNCATCHSANSHNAGMDPYECVDCHGNNGATIVSHGNNCRSCHASVNGHPAASFPYTDSCVACHHN